MTGGQGSFFDVGSNAQPVITKTTETTNTTPVKKHDLVVIKATEDKINEHEKYLQNLKKKGKCVWLDG